MFFLSGLPRSGSTLLQVILNQNPNIHVSNTSPLPQLMWDIQNSCEKNSKEQLTASNRLSFKEDLLSAIPDLYYKNSHKYIIDKSRAWLVEDNMNIIRKYVTKDPKIIVMIRPIEEIICSFKSIVGSRNIFSLSEEGLLQPMSEALLKPLSGVISAAKDKKNKNNLLIVTYKDISESPQLTIKTIYEFLNIPSYSHTFDNLKQINQEKDEIYGVENMHKVRSTIKSIRRECDLSSKTKSICLELNNVLLDALDNLL